MKKVFCVLSLVVMMFATLSVASENKQQSKVISYQEYELSVIYDHIDVILYQSEILIDAINSKDNIVIEYCKEELEIALIEYYELIQL